MLNSPHMDTSAANASNLTVNPTKLLPSLNEKNKITKVNFGLHQTGETVAETKKVF